jgi:hypothetical protein
MSFTCAAGLWKKAIQGASNISRRVVQPIEFTRRTPLQRDWRLKMELDLAQKSG